MRFRAGSDSGIGVSVNNQRCHHYGMCQSEAGEVFQLTSDGRLHYDPHPPDQEREHVRMAERCCPMQAITITERTV
jgi:sulfoxide reductase heme-binding subunit YedZ